MLIPQDTPSDQLLLHCSLQYEKQGTRLGKDLSIWKFTLAVTMSI